ncbi:MAG: hypothetical protein ABR554_02455, partial [Pyrinomonadaceae bacterium]
AILTSLLATGILILWWKGVDMIALPGLGLIVGTPIIVLLLLVAEIALVILAVFGRAVRANA